MPLVCSSSNDAKLHKYALVSYIPDPLASFLDTLRLELQPTCRPHAHVTVLPPRQLCGTAERAAREISRLAAEFEPFTVRLGGVEVFPGSNVIYIALDSGCAELRAMYQRMNCGASKFKEQYSYSPHVTMAQELSGAGLDAAVSRARKRWADCGLEKSFVVDRLWLVRSLDCACWEDVQDYTLGRSALGPDVTQTDRAEDTVPA